MKNASFMVVLAGGGTGGHIIPAISIANEVVHRGGQVRFIGTSDKIEAKLVPQSGYGIDFIKVKPLAGGGIAKKTIGAAAIPLSVINSMILLRKIKPNVVVGVGGYVAGPVVMAAKLLRLPTAVLEQNATVGLTNKILSKFVNRAFVSYKETANVFPAGRALHTGNPVKQSILEASKVAKLSSNEPVKILVMGGSQGAAAIDHRVPEAMSFAKFGNKVEVLHQCKSGCETEVKKAYKAAGIKAKSISFIEDTAKAFLDADLLVARSGATTVAEITVMGLPAVFLPYPHHTDKQQEKNAAPMVAADAAVIVDEKTTGKQELAEAISLFVLNKDKLQKAAKASKSLGKPEAAEKIVDVLVTIGQR